MNIKNSQTTTDLDIITTIAIPYDIVRNIAGPNSNVTTIVDSETDIHSFTGPTTNQISAMESADVIFSMGIAGAEPWLEDVTTSSTNIAGKIVNLTSLADGYEDPLLNGEINPHVWMNPNVVKKMASVVTQTLGQLDPTNKAYFESNNATYQQKLDTLLNYIAQNRTQYFDGMTVVVSHPAFYYLFDLLGIQRIASIEGHEHGEEPSQEHINDVIQKMKDIDCHLIVTTPQQNSEIAIEIARAVPGTKIAEMSAIPGIYEGAPGQYNVSDYFSMIEWCLYSLRNPVEVKPESIIAGYPVSFVFSLVGICVVVLVLKSSRNGKSYW
ncbi:MAG: metal ABC transporter substrate-binding protein [Promethearchaeota archaeon]